MPTQIFRRVFTLSNRIAFALAASVMLAALEAPALAQSEKAKDKDALRKEGEQIFGPGKAKPASGTVAASFWSVVIEAFRGDDQEATSREGLKKLRAETGLADAYLEKRGTATIIAYGKYSDGASPEARAGLDKVRNTEVIISNVKTKPFDRAFLAPPAEIPGTMPEYDLRQAKKLNGDWVIYTLQMAVYTRRDKAATPAEMAEFRKAAETAVTQLRREGEQAFYYHGPTGSMVTIGLFGKDDYDVQNPGVESPELTALRKRYPYNLLNGAGMKEKITVSTQSGKHAKMDRTQPSQLVAVPKSD